MHRFIFLLFLLLGSLQAQQTDTLYILQTTDVHGNIRPYDYFHDAPADYGLAKIYTRVIDYRKHHKNVILLDGGDLLQGTPLVYYFNKVETSVPNPLILTLNYMGYDAFTVGNHDIEQGVFVYLRAQKESDFPWLSANSVLEDGRTFFKPYAIFERNGIKIGVIGLTTPGIPMWLDQSLYPGVRWADMVETARKYASLVRPQVDVLVGLFHAGFEAEYSMKQTQALGMPNENASLLVAEQVPEFDVVFAGHSHRPFPILHNGVSEIVEVDARLPLRINAGSWGRNLGVAQIILKRQNNSPPEIVSKTGWLESTRRTQPSASILQLTEYYHKKTLQYIRQPIATLTDTLDARSARLEDNPVVELINKAQLWASGADISFAASFNDRLKIAPGKIRIKDIYGMYRYENYLYVLEMTGQQIKDYLDYCAAYYLADKDHVVPNPKIAGYNYDMAEGIAYTVHVRARKNGAAPGKGAKNYVDSIIFLKTGQPLKMDQTYRVAMNSYRATGGGGHLAAAHAGQAPVVWKSDEEMRNILAEYIQSLKIIHPQADGNWKVVIE